MQQATCAHSGADTGTSPGNDEISSAPSRRALLSFAGVGAIALAVPAAASLPQASPWDLVRNRWERAAKLAADFNKGEYETARQRLEARTGKRPELWFEVRAKNGKVARFPVNPESGRGPYMSPVLEEKHLAIATAWNEWFERCKQFEDEPAWSVADNHMDALYDAADAARDALMNEPAPHAAALALKVQLMLENEEIWETDRVLVSADAARLNGG